MSELVSLARPIQILNPTTDQIYESMRPTLADPDPAAVPAPTPVYMTPAPPVDAPTPVANQIPITAIPAAAPAESNKLLIVGALGIGALLLLSKKGRNVSGKNKKSLLVPILIVGGAAAYYFLSKKPEEAAPPEEAPAGSYYNAEKPSAYIAPSVPIVEQGRSAAAANSLPYLQSNWPQYLGAFNQMTDAEIISMYQYLYGYVSFGKKLYQYPGITGQYSDGDWNTALYNAVDAIRSKYNINF